MSYKVVSGVSKNDIKQHSKSKTMHFMNILKEQVQNVQTRH